MNLVQVRRLRSQGLLVLSFMFGVSSAVSQQYAWEVAARPTTVGLAAVDFIDTLNGVIGRGSAGFYVTTDGGTTWTPGIGATFSVQTISMVDHRNGWAAGVLGSSAGISRTTTGGAFWTEVRSADRQQYWGTAAFGPERNTTAGRIDSPGVQSKGLILETTDAGAIWRSQSFGSISTMLRHLTFVDTLHGWCVPYRSASVVLRTTDGGEVWESHDTPYWFDAICFIDSLRGWGGVANAFLRTTDGGVTWEFLTSLPPPEDFHLEDLSFTDSLYGWAFGGAFYQGIISEAIYHTTDGGYTWFRESIGLTDDLGILADGEMLDRRHGWAVAEDGRVLAYRLVTGVVERLPGTPEGFVLRQNYPNPFNASTVIEYDLPAAEDVRLVVVNATGQTVKTLVDTRQEAGVYRVTFDAGPLASGVYWYRLTTGRHNEAKEMILLK